MKTDNSTNVCPVEKAGGLDNAFRRLLQNPRKILEPLIRNGMTVLDLGCGPGFFSLEIAKLLTGSGKVIAADLQEGMLEKVKMKIAGTNLEQKISLHKCGAEHVGVTENVDFILAFYMVHEVPDQEKLFKELFSILKPNGQIFIIEPKFHVTKKSFKEMVHRLESTGLKVLDNPKVFFSRAVLLSN